MSLNGLLIETSSGLRSPVQPPGMRDRIMLYDYNFSNTTSILWDPIKSITKSEGRPPKTSTRCFSM
ncbi:hypothetical protein L873DRAFT_1043510 [Choiromyces venosus 120613-1]|uniref:Uncharacterized protein n=1 Tax=Choiromyces venosus 120613-1 TaxID=1336337 RepID=A0A3N4JJI9_9PEZI|nr:hypothetical protein L873DRAFT_1043510 [Choiromyces venosus 120613-1]